MVREAAQAGENEGELAVAEQIEAEFAANPSKIRRARAFANSVRWLVMDQRKLIAAITRSGPGGHQFMLVPDYLVARRIGKMVYSPRNVFISSDPTVVSGVLTDMKDNFSSGDAYQFLAPYFGTQSVFVVDSELHRQAKRELIQTIKGRVDFDQDRIASVAAHIDSLLPAGNYRLLPLIQNISARIIFDAIFPGEHPEVRNEIIRSAVDNLAKVTGSLLLFPSLWPKRSARMRKIRDNRARILRYVRANLGRLAVASNGASNVQALSRRASADNLVTLFIAGFETTAATTAWALMALAARQNDQTKLRTEILANSADPETFARYVNSTDNNLHSFATEVLRCHPSVPFILRRVERDTTLSVDGAAISLSTGNYVLLSIDEFNKNLDPMGKRFEPFDSARAYDTNSLLTFGGGQKICPGRHLATTEIKLIVALILSRASLHASERRGGTIVRNRVAAIPDCGAAMTVRIFDDQISSTRVARSH